MKINQLKFIALLSLAFVAMFSFGVFAPTSLVFAQVPDTTGSTTPVLPDEEIPPPIPPVTINLDIETPNATLFNGTLEVAACAPVDGAPVVVSGYCAVKQSGLASTWSSFGGAQFLDSVAGVGNDYQNNFYWGWFANLEYGVTSLDQHILTSNERLIVTLGKMPLKISVPSTAPAVGTALTVSVFQFGFDESWNPVWLPAAQGAVYIESQNGSQTQEAGGTGQSDVAITSTAPFSIFASKNNFIDSLPVTISPVSADTGGNGPGGDTGGGNPGGSGGSGGGGNQCSFNVTEAAEFLAAKQNANGAFGSSVNTDWAAIALAARPASGATGAAREKVAAFLRSSDERLSRATDYERHAMALMALGINPYTGTSENLIQKIVELFDGTQVGDDSLVNDDVFAIFPLMKAGYSTGDQVIQKTIAFIISKQNANGSWENSVDLTAAAIQALVLAPATGDTSAGGISADRIERAKNDAKNYLTAHQQADGGFGSSFSTSWVLQAIAALGESPSSAAWTKNSHTPEDALCADQQADGGVGEISAGDSTRVWATAYAIPAGLNKPWSAILRSFRKPASIGNGDENRNENENQPTPLVRPIPVPVPAPVPLLTSTSTPALSPVTPVATTTKLTTKLTTEPATKLTTPADANQSQVKENFVGMADHDSNRESNFSQLALVFSSVGRWPAWVWSAVLAALCLLIAGGMFLSRTRS